MRQAWATVRELLAATHAERKAELDAGRVDPVFQMGDRVLSRTNIGKLRPRWDGPFTAPARPSPSAYILALPRRMRCSATANVGRPKPFFERSRPRQPRGRGRRSQPLLRPGAGAKARGGAACRWWVCGIMRCMVQRRKRTSADDERLREEELARCQDEVAHYDRRCRAGHQDPPHVREAPGPTTPGHCLTDRADFSGTAPPCPVMRATGHLGVSRQPAGARATTSGEVSVVQPWRAEAARRRAEAVLLRAAGGIGAVRLGRRAAAARPRL